MALATEVPVDALTALSATDGLLSNLDSAPVAQASR